MPETELTEQSPAGFFSRQRKNHRVLICVCITFLYLLALLVFVGFHFHYENTAFIIADATNYLSLSASDFVLKDGGISRAVTTNLSDQGLIVEGKGTLSYVLPEDMQQCNTFAFETDCRHLRISVAGETVYESKVDDDGTMGRYTGSRLFVCTLPEEADGQELTIEILSDQTSNFSSFRLLTEASFVSAIYNSSLPRLLLCAVFSVFAYVEFVYWLIAKRVTSKKNLYFSLLLFVLSLWLFSDSNLLLFYFENGAVVIYITTFLFALLVPVFCLYLKEAMPGKRKVFSRLCIIFCLVLLVAAALILANVITIFYFLILCHLMLLAAFISAIVFCFQSRSNPQSRPVAVLLLISALTAVAALLAFYIPVIHAESYSYIVICGMLLACAANVISRAASSNKLLSDADMLGYYKKLAYTDYLTGLRNKAAYEKVLKQWDKTDVALAVIMFDSNNLKQVNDRYGHESGDKLLRSTAYCLTTGFGEEHTVYRVGGDEFIVLLAPKENEDIQQLVMDKLNKFNELVLRNNENSELKISIAYGYSIRQKGELTTAAQLALTAEQIMYQNKRASHKSRRRS